MKRKILAQKFLAFALTASVTAGMFPTSAFAVTGSQVAADGTYTKTAHVTRTGDDEWDEYDVAVSLTVENGKFSNITVTPQNGYDKGNDYYFNKAYNKSKGIATLLEGEDATEKMIQSWDSVSGATRTSDAVKAAALEAIHSASEKVELNTASLSTAISNAKALKEADYTSASWKAMQDKLTAAEKALSAKESQNAIDTAEKGLNLQ